MLCGAARRNQQRGDHPLKAALKEGGFLPIYPPFCNVTTERAPDKSALEPKWWRRVLLLDAADGDPVGDIKYCL